ncbi:hypothetical protein ABVT39_022552 [Epinephelus coioides]
MATAGVGEDGTPEHSEFSLTKAVEDVSQHGCTLTEALEEKEKILSKMQAVLLDVEKKGEMAEQELRSIHREFLMLEAEMAYLEQRTKVLHDRCASICKDNTDLQISISEEEKNARMALERFNIYRDKMEGHRAAVSHVLSQTEAHKELEEKRALVKMLKKKKEELKKDLENPDGNTVQMAKSEIDALKREISLMREKSAKKREHLQKSFENQAQLKKSIEIHNRRYEAIIKHLLLQLSRAKAANRQISEDVYTMERELAELKEQLQSFEDSSVSGQ